LIKSNHLIQIWIYLDSYQIVHSQSPINHCHSWEYQNSIMSVRTHCHLPLAMQIIQSALMAPLFVLVLIHLLTWVHVGMDWKTRDLRDHFYFTSLKTGIGRRVFFLPNESTRVIALKPNQSSPIFLPSPTYLCTSIITPLSMHALSLKPGLRLKVNISQVVSEVWGLLLLEQRRFGVDKLTKG